MLIFATIFLIFNNIMNKIKIITLFVGLLVSGIAHAWPGMPMPKLHVEGRWLVDEDGNHVNLHGFGQTYSPWFNEQGSQWNNYNVNACLNYNKGIIDGIMDAEWKMTFVRMHMDPYWSNTPGSWPDGESDISYFDFNRFKKYLDEVFIPMAEYAISKGLYVVMRPPGVCPHHIEVGGRYHDYLKKVWGYVATVKQLTDNPYVMFELANEPVDILGDDGNYSAGSDAAHRALTQFFQEIVDLMRSKGCQNILWVPGTGYQSQYAGFAKYPIQGENIGYAVHVYPGWYGSDALEPSHELGGSYGGGFDSFSAGWKNQIEPCAAIAPIIVTEMDWLPSKYEASWGKSITGWMLGAGFGANFKLLADRTGNVSWMIFTGPELLKNFTGVEGSEGYYTMYNDPQGCIWSTYYWFDEYAGYDVPEAESVNLYFSPRKGDQTEPDEGDKIIMTGGRISAALIADRGLGFDFNVPGEINVDIADPSVVTWDNNYFTALKQGETSCNVSYSLDGQTHSLSYNFVSTPFPFKGGYFNPSIWETGQFDENTCEIVTGQYGFAGWKYADGLDMSDYNYLICETVSPESCGLSLRLFDTDNYWSDPAMTDFNGKTSVVVDLRNLKSNQGRKVDSSHIYIAGFWTYGGKPFRIKSIFLSNDPNAAGVESVTVSDASVNVYNMQGMLIRSNVPANEATYGLPAALYIVGGKKVIVSNR